MESRPNTLFDLLFIIVFGVDWVLIGWFLADRNALPFVGLLFIVVFDFKLTKELFWGPELWLWFVDYPFEGGVQPI